jgi:hypothetical protein
MAGNILLVEGSDDLHTIMHLLIRHGYDYNTRLRKGDDLLPEIHELGGKNALLDSIESFIAGAYERIGFIIDADMPITSCWQSVRNRLRLVGVDTPANPIAMGFIGTSASLQKQVGVWLMPDNQRDGTLEHFLRELVQVDDSLFAHARQATAGATQNGARFAIQDTPKAEIHTWLAWQETPGLPFGAAVGAHYFLHDQAIANAFVDWFKRLYGV